jgi:hypothetical protein
MNGTRSRMGEANTRPVADILNDVKKLAVEYYHATGKPLGVTGEIAEFEAARVLGLTLAEARSPGADAIRVVNDRSETIQIKGRWKRDGAKWGRVPSIKTGPGQPFDVVMLVLLQGGYELHSIWEMPHAMAAALLDRPVSRVRNELRSLAVSQFMAKATRVWPPETCGTDDRALPAGMERTGV